jgi:hypothetical protein
VKQKKKKKKKESKHLGIRIGLPEIWFSCGLY